MRVNGGSYCMKIKQLSVHTRAVSKLCGCRVLTKGPIIGQPNTAAKMLMRTRIRSWYCKRSLQQWGKCDTKMRDKIPNALVQVVICSILWCDFLGCNINAIRLSKRSCAWGSQVYRQQIAQINVLADHNLRHKLCRNWRNARSNNKRLISHDQSSRCQQVRHSYVTRDTRRPAKGTGRKWKGRQSRGSESQQEQRHTSRRSGKRPTCRWLSNNRCWCCDSRNSPIALEEIDVVGEDELLALSAAIAACVDRPIKATISGDREGPEDKPAWSEMAESLTSVDWGIEAATEADDSSNSNWELLLVGPEVMIKENVPVRGRVTKLKEDPTQQKTTITTAPKSNMSNLIDSYKSALKSLRPC